jgi:hypothetical protein
MYSLQERSEAYKQSTSKLKLVSSSISGLLQSTFVAGFPSMDR